MTNLYGTGAPGYYPTPAYPAQNYPASQSPVPGGTAYPPAFSDPDTLGLILRLLDHYSYNKDLKESSALQSSTRDLVNQRGERYAAEALLQRLNGNFAAQSVVCQLLGVLPPRPLAEEDFRSVLNAPLKRSDLKKAKEKLAELAAQPQLRQQFNQFEKDDVGDALVLFDLLSGQEALSYLLPADLRPVFLGPDGTKRVLTQLFSKVTQTDSAALAELYGIGGQVTLGSLMKSALPTPDSDNDLNEALCKLDPPSCQPAPGAEKGADQAAEPPKEKKNLHAIVFDGGLRLRFQDDKSVNDPLRTDRVRYKAVAGATVQVVPDLVKAKVGLIAGASDKPRSPNNTDQLEMPLPRINLAYAELAPGWDGGAFSFSSGRLPLPLWLAADTVFDKDITWDGLAASLLLKADDNFTFFLNSGFLPLVGGSSSSKGSYLYPVQGGIYLKNETVELKTGLGHLGFSGVKGNAVLPYRSTVLTNDTTAVPAAKATDPAVTVYNYSYDAVIFDYQLTFKFAGGVALSHYGEFSRAYNAPSEANKSYTFGGILSLLDQRLTLNYSYRRLEREAILDVFPDDDFYGGGSTDVSGHKVKAVATYYKDKTFSVGSNLQFFLSDRINPAASNRKTTVMVDFLEVGF